MKRTEKGDSIDEPRASSPGPVPQTRVQRHLRGPLRRNLVWILPPVLLMLALVGWSYGRAMTAAGSENWSTRSVEWIKNHGGRGIVIRIESWWYSHHKPPVGGRPSGGIPTVAEAGDTTSPPAVPSPRPAGPRHLQQPSDIRPIAASPLPHEGRWQPLGVRFEHVPTMYVSYLRPDSVHTSLLTTVVWMDTDLLRATLYAGTQLPGGSDWKHYADVGTADRTKLAAAFNSGFALKDTRGGWYSDGRTAQPLVTGGATLVIYKDGAVNVGQWGRDVRMTPTVASARQNLSLIVDHGHPVPGLATQNFREWGATFGGGVLVWRSGVGVDANGGLLYAAGPGLSADSLARVLARAGAVRAMELDINHSWMTFDWFRSAPATPYRVAPKKLLDNPYRSAYRYLIPDERDFFVLSLRHTAPK